MGISFRGTVKERFDSTVFRFNQKWHRDPKTKCWIWTGAVKNKSRKTGYSKGNMLNSVNGRVEDATRISLWIHRPDDLSGNIQIVQTCGNKLCVNPDHLDTVPYGEAISRGERHPHSKLNADLVRSLRKVREYNRSRVSLKDLAEKFGVSRETIRKVAKGMSSSLPEEAVLEIRTVYKPLLNVRSVLPKGLRVTKPAIDRAVSGASWRHVHS